MGNTLHDKTITADLDMPTMKIWNFSCAPWTSWSEHLRMRFELRERCRSSPLGPKIYLPLNKHRDVHALTLTPQMTQ